MLCELAPGFSFASAGRNVGMLGNGAMFKVKERDSKYRRGEGSKVEHINPCRSHGGAWLGRSTRSSCLARQSETSEE
jgi:hypothetical protein